MPYIKVDTDKLAVYRRSFGTCRSNTLTISQSFRGINNNLDWDIQSSAGIRSQMREIQAELDSSLSDLQKMAAFLQFAQNEYLSIVGRNSHVLKEDAETTYYYKSAYQNLVAYLPGVVCDKAINPLVSVPITMYKPSQTSIQEKNENANMRSRESYSFDLDGWGVERIDGGFGGTAYIGKISAKAENEHTSSQVTAYVGKSTCAITGDANFFSYKRKAEKKKTEEYPQLQEPEQDIIALEGGVEVSFKGLEINTETIVGDDMLGLETGSEVSIGEANATGKVDFSVSKNGTVDFKAEGEAMVAAVSGEGKANFNILGLEIGLNAGGYVGALGVEGKFGIDDNKFVMKGGIAAVLGVSAGIEIGFNDTGWINFVDGIIFWD